MDCRVQEGIAAYKTRIVPLSEDLGWLIPLWKSLNERYGNNLLDCDPEWLLEERRGEESTVAVFLLEEAGQVVGVVPIEKSDKPHFFKLSEARVLRLPFKSFRLLGYSLSVPADAAAYDSLFSALGQVAGDFHALYMGHVEVESFLWNYLRASPLVKKYFRSYSALEPQPHPVIRFSGTFEDYMRKFSPDERRNRLRELRRLRERFQVELARFTQAAEVSTFFDAVLRISGNTWQFQLHGQGWGITAADPAVWKRRLEFVAGRGWLRSYVLNCDGTPCAFILGLQHGGRYHHMFVAFDQGWARHRVGNLLQLLVLEDLFKENPPELYDFGTFFEYKAHLANECYLEQRIALFPRRLYPLLVQILDRAWHIGVHQAALLLHSLQIKAWARRVVRQKTRTMKKS